MGAYVKKTGGNGSAAAAAFAGKGGGINEGGGGGHGAATMPPPPSSSSSSSFDPSDLKGQMIWFKTLNAEITALTRAWDGEGTEIVPGM
jgi:hypothetical protein